MSRPAAWRGGRGPGVGMAYCTQCGQELGPDDQFCGACGQPLATGPPGVATGPPGAATGPAPGAQVQAAPRPARDRRALRPALTVPLVAVVLAAVGAGAYAIGHQGRRASAETRAPAAGRAAAGSSSSGSPASPAPPTFAQLYQQDSSGVVRIDDTSCSGGGVGSGFLISPTLVATAAHVVDGAVTIALTAAGRTTVGSVVGVNDAADVALVQATTPLPGHVFTVSDTQPPVGTQVGVIGFPEGGPIAFTEGTVSGLDRVITINGAPRSGLVQTDAPLNPGNSGGPLLLADGTVVGLADAVEAGAAGIGYGVPATTAGPLLTSWAQAPQPPQPASCSNPLGPQGFGMQVQASGADVEGIKATLTTYFDAIDGGDYSTAYAQLDAREQAATSLATFSADDASSYDFGVSLVSVTQQAPGTDVVAVDFTSLQNPSQSPGGDSCDYWTLDYTMTQVGGSWLIDSALGHNGVASTPCG